MKIRSLRLEHFKKFTKPTRLEGVRDGLNILARPNEEGKSTLLDALRAVLFERHSSRSRGIKDLQTKGNETAPRVELAFELEDGLYRIEKRFLKQFRARLHCPDGREFHDDDAEEELRNLLRFSKPGSRGANDESLGMWSVLWVRQGDSFDYRLADSAQTDLRQALDTEVSDLLGGSQGQVIPEAVGKQLLELVSEKTAQPRGRYKQVMEEVESLEKEIGNLSSRREDFSETLDQLEEAQEELRRLAAIGRDKQDREELAAARARLAAVKEIESRIEAAAKELELRRLALEDAERKIRERAEMRERADATRKEAGEMEKSLHGSRSLLGERKRIHEEKLKDCRRAEAEVKEAERELARRRRIVDAVRIQAEIRILHKTMEGTQQSLGKLERNRKEAAAIRATRERVEAIRQAAGALDSIRGQLRAAATHIAFDLKPAGRAGIEINGEPLGPDTISRHAVEVTTILIPERGSLTIDPSIGDRDQLLLKREEIERKFEEALADAGARSLSDAEEQFQRRTGHLQEIGMARKEIEIRTSAAGLDPGEHSSLRDRLEERKAILDRSMEELALQRLPGKEEAQEALQAAEALAEETGNRRDQARAALTGPEEAVRDCQIEATRLEERCKERSEKLRTLQVNLAEAETSDPEEALRDRARKGEIAVARQRDANAELENQRSEETSEQIESRIARLETVIETRRNHAANLKERIASLQSRIEANEGTGLDEIINEKTQLLALRKAERDGLDRDVRVLKLLLSELHKAEKEAKEKYLEPMMDCVRPYFRILFPLTELQIDNEELRLRCLTRKDGREEEFDILSMGTQEQIAVLFRLAFAELLVKRGFPATVVLDDALVFSDDTRIKRMFDILHKASERMQIIIFTCREELFRELGGHPLRLVRDGA